MTEKPFDPSKPVQTREGSPARIICTDRKFKSLDNYKDWPILALFGNGPNEIVGAFMRDGRMFSTRDDPRDLVNVPDIRYEYQNVYKRGTSTPRFCYATLEAAKNSRAKVSPDIHLGYLKYTFEDDEFKTVEFIRN
jgi:hypothetical protein